MLARCSSAFVGACLLLASPALAQSEPLSVTVNAADLDLATEAGQAQLDRRIRKAASRVCDNGSGGLPGQIAYQVCYSETMAAASRGAAQLAGRQDRTIRLARNAR